MAPHISGGLHLDPLAGYITGAVVALALFVFTIVKASQKAKTGLSR